MKPRKEEICEDWCFICKDGGKVRVCDHKDCLKVYHPECVGKDDSFLKARDRWICNRHLCFICYKTSKFRCFCCTKSVCGRCVNPNEFVLIRGNKGFCDHCLKLVKLIQEDKDVDSDGEKVNFREQNTVEFLFMEYWEIINETEKLTLETIQSAYAHLKKGRNFIAESELDEIHASEDEDERLVSDYDDRSDEGEKRKRLKRQPHIIERNVKSKNKEFVGWGSKALIEFLEYIGKDTTEQLTQDEVTSIIIKYVTEKKLFDAQKKKKVLCDARLQSILRRKSVNKNRISDLLEAHFTENLVQSEEEYDDKDLGGIHSDGKDENILMDCKRVRNSIRKRKPQKKEVDVQQTCFASIVEQNLKLVFLRRSLVEEMLKQPETLEEKVVGSFVRVKSDPNDYLQKNSHQLLQVTGIKKNLSSGKIETEILLQISNRPKDIPISMLSDEDFSEEECEDLRRKVKDGLHKNPTIVEFEQKVRTLHEDITNHWIAKELAILQNRIDQANEKGWRREFFEYSEKRQLLQTSSEQSRLIHEVPEVIGHPAETEPISEDCLGDCKQERCGSLEMIPEGTSESPSKSLEGNGTRCILRGRMHAAEERQHLTEESIPEELPQQSYIPDPGVEHKDILQKLPPQIITEENHQLSEELPQHMHAQHKSDGTLQSQPIDVEQAGLKDERPWPVQVIELSDDDEEEKPAVVTGEDPESSIWYCKNPLGELKGPFSSSLLKRWSDLSEYALKFKVWKTGQREDESILMTDAIRQLFPTD